MPLNVQLSTLPVSARTLKLKAIIEATKDEATEKLANTLKQKLISSGITVSLDNSDKTFGYKLAEAEVNGIPVRIELGKRDIENKVITISRRDTLEKQTISIDSDIVTYINNLMEDIQSNLYNKAKKRKESMTYHAKNLEEVKKIMDTQPGFIYAPWCGSEECELKMKDIKGLKSRCITEDNENEICPVCGKKSKHIVVWGIQY